MRPRIRLTFKSLPNTLQCPLFYSDVIYSWSSSLSYKESILTRMNFEPFRFPYGDIYSCRWPSVVLHSGPQLRKISAHYTIRGKFQTMLDLISVPPACSLLPENIMYRQIFITYRTLLVRTSDKMSLECPKECCSIDERAFKYNVEFYGLVCSHGKLSAPIALICHSRLVQLACARQMDSFCLFSKKQKQRYPRKIQTNACKDLQREELRKSVHSNDGHAIRHSIWR